MSAEEHYADSEESPSGNLNAAAAPKFNKLATVFVFISALFYATGGVCYKFADWAPLAISAARSLIAIPVMLTFAFVTGHRFKFNRNVLLAGLGGAGTGFFYSLANKMTTAGNSIVLQFTMPVFVILIMWIFFKRKPGRLEMITAVLVIVGIVFFFLDSIQVGNYLGDLLALLSGFCYAFYFIFNSRQDADPIMALFISYAVNITLGLPDLIRTDFAATTATTWTAVLVLGLVQQSCGHIFFSTGITKTPAVTAALVSGIEPVLNPILVALIYGETLSLLSLIGAAIVLVTIISYDVIKARTTVLNDTEKKP